LLTRFVDALEGGIVKASVFADYGLLSIGEQAQGNGLASLSNYVNSASHGGIRKNDTPISM
jgi:ATP-dependent Zn protease